MSTTFVRRTTLGAVAAVAVATLATGCGSSTANDQTPGGTSGSTPPSGGTSATTSAPAGGGAAF